MQEFYASATLRSSECVYTFRPLQRASLLKGAGHEGMDAGVPPTAVRAEKRLNYIKLTLKCSFKSRMISYDMLTSINTLFVDIQKAPI